MRFDLSNAWNSVHRIVNNTISLLPNLLLAVGVFVIFLIVASIGKSLVRRTLRGKQRPNVALLLGQLASAIVIILGFLIAFSIVAPSFRAGDLIKMLGIGSVAIGFAFQNILQNFLAGVLLLVQEPFQIGDWISVTGIEGTVDDIQTRATVVGASDGRRVVIPNAVLFTSPVAVGKPPAKSESGKSEQPTKN